MFRGLYAGERVALFAGMRAILAFVLCVGAAALVPERAHAATVDQIVALSKAGVSEPVILALIDRDKTIFPIEPEQLPTLKQQGLSDAIIMAMLKSGREEGEAAARAEAASNAARILASLSTAPEVLIVGHGPETPNTTHYGYDDYPGYYHGAPPFLPYAVPYGAAYTPFYSASFTSHRDVARDRGLCTAPATPASRFVGTRSTFVNDCPAPIQLSPGRRRVR